MSDTTLNQFISRGTNAQRIAFTPSPATPATGNNPSYIFYETDTTNTYMWDGSAWQKINTGGGTSGPIPAGLGGWEGMDHEEAIIPIPNQFSTNIPGVVPPSGGGTTNFLRADGTWAATPGGGDLGAFWAYEEQASGTAGGISTSNTWTTRVLNTNPVNSISGASIASNIITLPAGTFDVWASSPIYTGGTTTGMGVRLYNTADSAVAIKGESIWNDQETRIHLQGRITIAGSKTFAVQTWTQLGITTNGLGVNVGFSDSTANHFTDILIKRVA